MRHTRTVQDIYAAFGRGDIPAILAHLAENVEWEYDKTADGGIPWLVPRQGRAEVPRFFESLGAVQFEQFQPKLQFENGNIVVALNDVAFVVKATGRRVVDEDEVHIWYFNDDGLVARFCHKVDTQQHARALAHAA